MTVIAPFTDTTKGALALLGAVAAWGSTFVVTKLLLVDIGPFTILALRFPIALAVLVPFARPQGFRMRMLVQPTFLLFGASLAAHFGLQNLGLVYTTAGNAALVVAGIPAVSALLSVLVLRERLSARLKGGVFLSIAGVVLLTSAPIVAGSWSVLLGNVLVFGAVLTWALYTLQGKLLTHHHSALVAATASTGAALVLLLVPFAWELSVRGLPQLSATGWALIAYLGVVASAVGFYLWNRGLHYVDAAAAGPFVNLVPVTGVMFALLLGERITPVQVAGGMVVGLGVWLSHRG
ncbi:MAG: DMT family transporter [Egibacteraceae bacterium]